jgi:hypothetical protein
MTADPMNPAPPVTKMVLPLKVMIPPRPLL